MEEITRICGEKVGSVSLVLVGVHGDEVCGPNALDKILPTLRIKAGTVIFALGNPRALEQNVRYTETNLNRMFKPEAELSDEEKSSYEFGRAKIIKELMIEADVLLDIHASFTPESKPFLICEPNSFAITKSLPFDLTVSGFDTIEPGGTDYYMNKIGKIGICAECGYLDDPSATDKAVDTILAFLQQRGHIENQSILKEYESEKITMHSIYLTKTDNFKLAKEFSDFEKLAVDELIGTDDAKVVKTESESIILFARNCEGAGEEAFLLGKVSE